jgi:hypothetical protein
MMQIVVASAEVAALLLMTLVAISTASLSLFIDYLMEHHPLGQLYLQQIQRLPENIAKPLGECVYCSGAWQYLFLSYFVFNQEILICLIGLGINHVALTLLVSLRNHFQNWE